MAQRRRTTNWSEAEIRTLVEWTVNYYDFLFGKFSSEISQEGKDAKWKEIADAVCAVGFVCRPVEKVNKKWRELKSSTKAKERKIRDAKKRTGGGPPPASLKDWEEKIVSVLPDCVVEGVEFGIDCFEESEVSVGDMALARSDDEIQCHLALENFLQSTNTPATLGSGKTPATLGSGKTPATLGSGKTPATLGSGKTPATLGSDKTPATLGSGKTPATLGSGKTPATLGSGKTPATLGSFKESITVQEKENSACSSTSALSITQSGRSTQKSKSRKRSCDCDLQLVEIQKGLLEESKKRNILLEKILNTLQNNNFVLIGGDQQPS